jgi:hypothetical protein
MLLIKFSAGEPELYLLTETVTLGSFIFLAYKTVLSKLLSSKISKVISISIWFNIELI